jgi:hypothetical protein
MKAINRWCTKVRAGEQIELAGGIVVKNPSPYKISLVIETPVHLKNQSTAPKEIISNENPTKQPA